MCFSFRTINNFYRDRAHTRIVVPTSTQTKVYTVGGYVRFVMNSAYNFTNETLVVY